MAGEFCSEHSSFSETLGMIKESVENLDKKTDSINAKLDQFLENRIKNGLFKGEIGQKVSHLEKQTSKLWELWDNKISNGLVKVDVLSGKAKIVIGILGAFGIAILTVVADKIADKLLG